MECPLRAMGVTYRVYTSFPVPSTRTNPARSLSLRKRIKYATTASPYRSDAHEHKEPFNGNASTVQNLNLRSVVLIVRLMALSYDGQVNKGGSVAMWLWIALVALAPLVIVVMLTRKVAKKYTPWGLVWWSVGLAGFAVAGISAANSTMPSTAPRLTVSGLAQGCAQQTIGRGNYIYSFLLMRTNAPSISLSTHIKLPICWSGPSTDSHGRLYRVKYLADPSRTLKNEAISIEG